MIDEKQLNEVGVPKESKIAFSDHSINGIPIPKLNRLMTFSPEDWEVFIEEWASSLKTKYKKVRRFGGAGDLGIDIAAFISDDGFSGEWDNYQCKRYDHPLFPGDIWIEIGKIIYYSFSGEYSVPRKHYFVCSKGIGATVERLLNNKVVLKHEMEKNWNDKCKYDISSVKEISLSGDLLSYFKRFNFSIFDSKSLMELIEDHSKTNYHVIRFGGGLPMRPITEMPPIAVKELESRYIKQILEAYSDHLGETISKLSDIDSNEELQKDFLRQRERFFEAEALRNFARDTVPQGTFESLQKEILFSVVDVCNKKYVDGFERMNETINHASNISINSNPLSVAINVIDKQGICHQLADIDQLIWVKTIRI